MTLEELSNEKQNKNNKEAEVLEKLSKLFVLITKCLSYICLMARSLAWGIG